MRPQHICNVGEILKNGYSSAKIIIQQCWDSKQRNFS